MAVDGEALSDFCVAAATQALENAGVAAKDLDAVLIATVTPDQPIPAMACLVQQKLGAKKAAAWDQNAGCSGWLYGLHIADGLVQAGKAKNILLVGAELLTRYTDYTDRATCVLFGDGAGATLLKGDEVRPGACSPRRSGATARAPASSRCREEAPRTRRTGRRRSGSASRSSR